MWLEHFFCPTKGQLNLKKGLNLCVYLLSGGEEVLLKLSPVGGSGPDSGGLRARSSRFSWAVHTPPASGVHLPGGPRASVTAADCRSGNSSPSSRSLEEQEETRPCSSWCGSEPRPSPLSQWPGHSSSLLSSHSPVTLNSPLIPSGVTRPTSLNSEENKFLFRACTLLRGAAPWLAESS